MLAPPAGAQTGLTIYSDGRVLTRRVLQVALPAGTSERRLALGMLDPGSLFSLDSTITILGAAYDAAVDDENTMRRAVGRRIVFRIGPGLLGAPLAELNITITFTWLAVVIAQVFVAAPFYIRSAQTRFAALPHELEQAASIDGADGWRVFWYVTLPLSRRALMAGLLLSWARALGEFGATILFAGNLQGRTQTMPLLVYAALERDLNASFISALILLIMAGLALGLTRWLSRLDDRQGDPLADR
jgi:ABC-type molybdate transport system permease subunit